MRDESSLSRRRVTQSGKLALRWLTPLFASSLWLTSALARADEPAPSPPAAPPPSDSSAAVAPAPVAEPVAEAPPTPKPKPPPYSLPWQLRPAAAATVVRSDTAIAMRKSPAGDSGTTVASMLLGSYKVSPDLAVMVRLGVVSDSPPVGDGASAFLNPVIGGTYVFKLSKEVRLAAFLGLALPLGNGGGNTPDKLVRSALTSGIYTRSAMDNAMFAVNYLTPFPGIDLAYVANGLTIQAEATLLQLIRARGDAVDKDAARTNFTAGLFAGYFLVPQFSLSAELRYQAWLKNPTVPTDAANRDTVSFAVGPRVHIKLSDTAWFRPGIAYARGLDKPMTDAKYNIVQLDLPFSF